jgi:alkyl sulfatase BDS1-like metallo-beta-lactamase superfamily hydrolase
MKRRGLPPTPSASSGVVVAFHLSDTGERFRVAARAGVATVLAGGGDDTQATVRLPQRVWIELLLGVTSLGEALLAEDVEAEGDLAEFVRFHRCFSITTATPRRQQGRGEPR